MNMTQVESTNVTSIGYDIEKQVIRVSYKSGSTYDYEGCGCDVWQELVDIKEGGGSVGRYIGTFIKPRHECKKVEEKTDPLRGIAVNMLNSFAIDGTEDNIKKAIGWIKQAQIG